MQRFNTIDKPYSMEQIYSGTMKPLGSNAFASALMGEVKEKGRRPKYRHGVKKFFLFAGSLLLAILSTADRSHAQECADCPEMASATMLAQPQLLIRPSIPANTPEALNSQSLEDDLEAARQRALEKRSSGDPLSREKANDYERHSQKISDAGEPASYFPRFYQDAIPARIAPSGTQVVWERPLQLRMPREAFREWIRSFTVYEK